MMIKTILIVFGLSIIFYQCSSNSQLTRKISPNTKIEKEDLDLPGNVEIKHLTKITYGDKKFILHGVFTKKNNNFSLKAFGDFDVLLFIVGLEKNKLFSKIIFGPLKEKNFNPNHVGEDLWRIYFAKNNAQLKLFRKKNKSFKDYKVKLKYNKNNFLTHKYFYDKSKLIYRISFKDYHNYDGVIIPKLTICEHLVYKYKLKIVTLTSSKN